VRPSDLPSTEANVVSIAIIRFARISQARREKRKQKATSLEVNSD
jgi:hypothetical protein